MNGLWTVFRKEVKENLRDRRAAFNSLLLGPLLFPLLFVGLMWFLESAERERPLNLQVDRFDQGYRDDGYLDVEVHASLDGNTPSEITRETII